MSELRRLNSRTVAIVLSIALVIVVFNALTTGAYTIRFGEVFTVLFQGPAETSDANSISHAVFWNVRLPRVALAIVVGASLAVAGVVMQGVFRNPLAEPATVGVSGGAAVGAVIAITLGLSKITLGVQIFAFIGGTLATAIVYGLSRVDGKTDVVTLILTGIAINALSGALIGLAVFIADDDQIRTVTFWSLGSLGLATWRAVAVVLPLAIIGIALSTKFARTLDLMALGDRSAAHVGVPVERVRLQTIAIVGLLASSAVADRHYCFRRTNRAAHFASRARAKASRSVVVISSTRCNCYFARRPRGTNIARTSRTATRRSNSAYRRAVLFVAIAQNAHE